jgi:gamma-glutamyl-gamma-aminobutyrate hydrolase PuuD
MPPRIAIPMPHSIDLEYAGRAIPQYERAVTLSGGEPVRIPLDRTAAEVQKIINSCDGVLLPGSNADVDPARFGAERSPRTAAADPRRDAVDDLLLADAFACRKPVLGICYGLQSLNVFRAGSLIQHIPDFLPEETRAKVNHEAGKTVAVAHAVEIDPGSKLAEIVAAGEKENQEGHGFKASRNSTNVDRNPGTATNVQSNSGTDTNVESNRGRAALPAPRKASGIDAGFQPPALAAGMLVLPVNSSHHQSAAAIGEGLRIVARCPDDGIIEALEGTAPDHFVVAVQWHPERSVDDDSASQALFRALIAAAK